MNESNSLPIAIFMLLCFSPCHCQTYENMTLLKTTLFTNYDPQIIPVNNQSEALKVTVTIHMYGLTAVDAVEGVLTIVAGSGCQWTDERLVWDPMDYDGIMKFAVTKAAVWTPGLTLGTPIKYKQLSQSWNKALVFSNGSVMFGPGDVLDSACTMSMKYWPFDKQLCMVSYFAADYTADMVELVLSPQKFQDFGFVRNSEWTLDGHATKKINMFGVDQVVFILKLKRQPMFYVLSIILPLTGLFVVNVLVFILPQQSGERVSFAMTITLALAVFLTVVTEEMPKASSPMSLMCIFILMGVINSLLIMVIVVLNSRLYFIEDSTPPKPWHGILVRISRLQCRSKVCDSGEHDVSNPAFVKSDRVQELTIQQDKHNLEDLMRNLERETTETTEQGEITWQDVSTAIDMICFWFFLIFSIVFCIAANLYVALGSDYDDSLLPIKV